MRDGFDVIYDFLPPERMREIQWQKLQRLLNHAYEHSPLYRRKFLAMGAKPGDFRDFDDLLSFPVLTRDEILHQCDEMLTLPKSGLTLVHSGGSTGHPLDIYYRGTDRRYRLALRRQVNGWLDAAWLVPSFKLWGVIDANEIPPLRAVSRPLLRQYRYYYNHLTEADLARLAGDFRAVGPRKLYGLASILKALAQYLVEKDLGVPRPPRSSSPWRRLFPKKIGS